MDWLPNDIWVKSAVLDPAAIVHRLGPKAHILLPSTDPHPDLKERIKQIQPAPGTSCRVVCIEAGLQPKWAYLLAAIGKKLGLWKLWPEWNSPLWDLDRGQFPLIEVTPQPSIGIQHDHKYWLNIVRSSPIVLPMSESGDDGWGPDSEPQ